MRKLISYSQVRLIIIFLSGMVLSSCIGAVQMVATVTPTPTRTITSTATLAAIPSSTATTTDAPEPTPTETLVPPQVSTPLATSRSPLRLKPAVQIPEAGFSFQPPIGYEERYKYGKVTISNDDEDIILSLTGSSTRQKQDLDNVLNRYLENIQETFQEFDTGTPYPYTISGSEGIAVDVNAEWSNTSVEGRIVIVAPNDEQLFFVVAICANGGDGNGWEPRGRQAFEAVMGSISFFKPIPSEQQD